jgi:hypothetical protein
MSWRIIADSTYDRPTYASPLDPHVTIRSKWIAAGLTYHHRIYESRTYLDIITETMCHCQTHGSPPSLRIIVGPKNRRHNYVSAPDLIIITKPIYHLRTCVSLLSDYASSKADVSPKLRIIIDTTYHHKNPRSPPALSIIAGTTNYHHNCVPSLDLSSLNLWITARPMNHRQTYVSSLDIRIIIRTTYHRNYVSSRLISCRQTCRLPACVSPRLRIITNITNHRQNYGSLPDLRIIEGLKNRHHNFISSPDLSIIVKPIYHRWTYW